MVGAYDQFKKPDAEADKVLRDNFEAITKRFPDLKDLKLESLLRDYEYARQVVAGLNYKFRVPHADKRYELVIWHKLDDTYELTSCKVL